MHTVVAENMAVDSLVEDNLAAGSLVAGIAAVAEETRLADHKSLGFHTSFAAKAAEADHSLAMNLSCLDRCQGKALEEARMKALRLRLRAGTLDHPKGGPRSI